MIERFLELQKEELAVRAKELELGFQQDNNQKEIAEKSISANLQDRENERVYLGKQSKIRLVGIVIVFFIVAAFCSYSLFLGKETVVMKIAEALVIFASGFIGGYGFRSAKASTLSQTKD